VQYQAAGLTINFIIHIFLQECFTRYVHILIGCMSGIFYIFILAERELHCNHVLAVLLLYAQRPTVDK
jgi:hypothetical protein